MSFLSTRGILAKLLATENLVVTYNHTAETASFDTDTRELTLPILDIKSENVMTMFVGHEVAHALWTPADWAEQVSAGVPYDFVNVIEDIRIERMVQDKFPGLRSDFSKGYDYLNHLDFFQLEGKDLSKLPFIDRINLNAKLGARALIPFTPEEMVYVKAAHDADSFDKVLLVAKMLADYIKQDKQQENVDMNNESNEQSGSSNNPGRINNDEPTDADDNNDSDSEGDSLNEDSSQAGNTGSNQNELVSQTQQAFDENLRDNTNNSHIDSIQYLNVSDLSISKVAMKFEDYIRDFYISRDHIFDSMRDVYAEFMSSIKSDVNFMVQQFEMKKSADAYARGVTHKTGVLDTNQLHNYKLTDDVFLRNTVTPEGKNHGMLMLLDWSGSMDPHILATVKQIIVLVQFCRKAQIPFDVYSFTTGYHNLQQGDNDVSLNDVSLINILTSNTKRNLIDDALFQLFCIANNAACNPNLSMGGTPLNNVLCYAPRLISEFKTRHGVQKVNFTVVTDGESSPVKNSTRAGFYNRVILRNGIESIMLGDAYDSKITGTLANWIAELPDVTVTNIFLGTPGECRNYLRTYNHYVDQKVFNKQQGYHLVDKTYWPLIVCINPRSFGTPQDQINVEHGASKASIRSALKKMLNSKQSCKLLLNQIVTQLS